MAQPARPEPRREQLISIVPILVIYFALQRSIINGFAGGLKG
ncbi:hypothetical protein [Virgisporangium aliadipatigenens]|nr:hypothetical protein [Virgisporangium aliadipatigenens]